MNRHGKFYAELAADLEEEGYIDDDDYYDEAEEDYYEGDCEEYEEKQTLREETPAFVNPYTSIAPETDVDFDILYAVIPALDNMWNAEPGIPLREEEAVECLRLEEYDPARALALIKSKRAAKKMTARSLKVSASPKSTAEMCAEADMTCVSGDKGSPVKSLRDDDESCGSPASPLGGKFTTDCTLVITGHVDAGKSTVLGHLLLLLGKVSGSDLVKVQDSYQFAWLLDQSEEERRRGVTIDSGTFAFETAHRKVHVLDAPGHKEYVLSMISSATQADAALLIVTAAKGEFEAGLHHGTREHLQVLRTLGVGSIIVAVNKMDAVNYSKERFDHVVAELKLLFQELQIDDDVIAGICPVSGMDGSNMVSTSDQHTPWYKGKSLLELIDACPLESRLIDAPLRVTVQDVQQQTIYAKIECGRLKKGASVVFLPCDVTVGVKNLCKSTSAGPISEALAGEQVEITARASPVGLHPGCIGCDGRHRISVSTDFEARIQTFEALATPLLPGTSLIMIAHALHVTVKILALTSKMDAKGNWSKGMVKCIPANTQAIVIFRTEYKVALDPVVFCRALGRFVFSLDGETVAGGLIQKVLV